jgi:hypothetical protein
MKQSLLVLIVLSATSATALADEVTAEPNDPGKVTRVGKGVKEIDLGGLFVFSHDKVEDVSTTKLTTLGGLSFQYFFNANVSAGVSGLFSYDKVGDASATSFGGLAFGSFHVRLGLGAFFRPTLGLGALFGNREIDAGTGSVAKLSQTAFLARIGLPFAYFPSKRVVLQAGPEIDIEIGSFKPDGGESTSFTTIAGGFGLAVGYVF